jgi:hypothetical protein
VAIPHIILFADANCSGNHTHVCETMSYIGDYFNDVTSSFVILEGNWQFFVDANFAGQMGPGAGKTLGPGVYNWIEDASALGPQTNDRLSSLKSV